MDLAALRESLRTLGPGALPVTTPDPRQGALSTGFVALDRLLGWGGLPRGAITELSGAASSGKTALALSAIAAHRGLAVFVDGQRQLFPPTAAALGVELSRLLVVRPAPDQAASELAFAAAQATEIVARSRAFALVVLDLPPGARLERSAAGRLRSAAQRASLTVLVLSSGSAVDGALARLRVCGLRGRPGRVAVEVTKGGRGGAPAHAELNLSRARLDDGVIAAVAQVTGRIAPGVEHAEVSNRIAAGVEHAAEERAS